MLRIPKDIRAQYKFFDVEVPKVNYIVSRKSQYAGHVNVEFIMLGGGHFFQIGENVSDAKRSFFMRYLDMEIEKRAQ